MTTPEHIDYIMGRLSDGDRLCQLAEEATELAQAALKLKRAMEGTNPTPVDTHDALHAVYEEIGDVFVCIACTFPQCLPSLDTVPSKIERWTQRLKQAE